MFYLIFFGGLAIIWAICVLYTYPHELAYFQRKWWNIRSAKDDRSAARMMCYFGPIGVGVVFFSNDWGKWGSTWHATDSYWALGKEERGLIDYERYRDEWDG